MEAKRPQVEVVRQGWRGRERQVATLRGRSGCLWRIHVFFFQNRSRDGETMAFELKDPDLSSNLALDVASWLLGGRTTTQGADVPPTPEGNVRRQEDVWGDASSATHFAHCSFVCKCKSA